MLRTHRWYENTLLSIWWPHIVLQLTEGFRYFLLSTLLCLLPLQMPGLLKGDTTSSTGKSCITEESGRGKPMMCALQLSERVLRMLLAVTWDKWTLPSAEPGGPGRRQCLPIHRHTWLLQLCNLQGSWLGVPYPTFLMWGVRTPRLAVFRAMVHLGALPCCLSRQHWESQGYFKQDVSVPFSSFSPECQLLRQHGFAGLKGPRV